MTRRVQTRLLLVFGVLFTCVMSLAFLGVWQVTRHNFRNQIDAQLDYIGTALQRQIADTVQTLQRETEIMSRDFGFRAAISTTDYSTVLSALGNFGRRIRIDRLLVYTADGVLFADSAGDVLHGQQLPDSGGSEAGFTRIVQQDDAVYFYAFTPVHAPDLIGWVGGGVRAGDQLARDIQSLLPGNPEVSFLLSGADGSRRLLATTLPRHQQRDFTSRIAIAANRDQRMRLAGEDFIYREHRLGTPEAGGQLVATVQLSLRDAYSYLQDISLSFMLACVIGLACVFAGSYLIARGFTRPLRQLASAAEHIQRGNYAVTTPGTRDDEFGFLARSFTHMSTAIQERERRIREQAQYDALTGLPNRLYLEYWLSALIAARGDAVRVSVALLSVDRLAEVTYVLGHEISDRVIAETGKLLQQTVRGGDIVTRIGFDTFGVAIAGLQPDDITPLLQRVQEVFHAPVRIDGCQIDVAACIGIASCPDHAASARDLMRAAERAVYTARNRQERYAWYDPAHDVTSSARLSLMSDLRMAIDHNQLELWYQPQLAAATGEFRRVEALVRWQHPERGLIPPDQFISMAERTGEIHRLTRWVLDSALLQMADWRARGLELQISVNLSARDLNNRELPTLIAELLHRYGINAAQLCVEITESAIMDDADSVLSILQVLRGTGLQVAIDDFGTGYSSLEYLARLPVTELKIDKAFVIPLAGSTREQLIVKSAIELAHGLGLCVVAEGVENSESARMLRDYGCDLLQGYAIGKPMTAPDLERWTDRCNGAAQHGTADATLPALPVSARD